MANSEAIVEDLLRDFECSGTNFEPDKLLAKKKRRKKEAAAAVVVVDNGLEVAGSAAVDAVSKPNNQTASEADPTSPPKKVKKKRRRHSSNDDAAAPKRKKSSRNRRRTPVAGDDANAKRKKTSSSKSRHRDDRDVPEAKKSAGGRRKRDSSTATAAARGSDGGGDWHRRRHRDDYYYSWPQQLTEIRTERVVSRSPTRHDRDNTFLDVGWTAAVDDLVTERISSPDDDDEHMPAGADYSSYLDDVKPSCDVPAVRLSDHLKKKGHEVPEALAQLDKKLDSWKQEHDLGRGGDDPHLPAPNSDPGAADIQPFPLSKEKVQKSKVLKEALIGKTSSLLPRNISLNQVKSQAANETSTSLPASPKRADKHENKPVVNMDEVLSRIEVAKTLDDREFKPPPGPVKGKRLGGGGDDSDDDLTERPTMGKRKDAIDRHSKADKKIQIGSLKASDTIANAPPVVSTVFQHNGEEGEIPISDVSLDEDSYEDELADDDSDGELQEELDGGGGVTPKKAKGAKKQKKKKKKKKEKKMKREKKARSVSPSSSASAADSYSQSSTSCSRTPPTPALRRQQYNSRLRTPYDENDRRRNNFERRRLQGAPPTVVRIGYRNQNMRYNDSRDYRNSIVYINPNFPRWRGRGTGFRRGSIHVNPSFGGGRASFRGGRGGSGTNYYYQRGGGYRGGARGGVNYYGVNNNRASWKWARGRDASRGYADEHNRRQQRSYSRSSSSSGANQSTVDSAPRDGDGRIDKKKLFEIARKNASAMLQVGSLQQIKNIGAEELAKLRSGGRSVQELVAYCKRLQKRELKKARRDAGEEVDSSSSDAESLNEKDKDDFINHPFALKESKPGIVLNIPGAIPLASKTSLQRSQDESTLRLTFPVSSGQQHRSKEIVPAQQGALEWTPVEKNDPVKLSKTLEPPPLPPQFPSLSSSQPILLPPPPVPPTLEPPPVPPKLVSPPQRVHVEPPPKAPIMDISSLVSHRLSAVKRLQENPNDLQAIKMMHDAEGQMKEWAESKNLPGQYVGTTGVQCLQPSELAPTGLDAWANKDQLNLAPKLDSGIGMKLLQKMGWNEGEGLGKNMTGALEPLKLDVKQDRKGLVAEDEMQYGRKSKGRQNAMPAPPLGGAAPLAPSGGMPGFASIACKNPVSVLMELCSKRRWGPPAFTCMESGASNTRRFLWKCVVNGVEYQPAVACTNKKVGKAESAQVVLQSLGVIPRNQALPPMQ